MNKKRILITGKGSYVGTSFIKWLKQCPNQYEVEELSVRGTTWTEYDFSSYDTVLHVAGIAHVSTDPKMEEQYYKVNRDLTIEVAEKAKKNKVKQFIFMSSIIVYGDSSSGEKVIDRSTIPKPSNFYGKSKLQAEEGIKSLESDTFKIVIIRPPMIYGKYSKGNYVKLSQFARKLPVFPDYNNKRSMLYIENLCEFLKLMIDNFERGLFFPQNSEHVQTSEMVKFIAEAHMKRIRLTRIFNPLLKIAFTKVGIVNKVFGNLFYEQTISEYKENYRVLNLRDSIIATEVER
ncbi:NAD-dependent epimerase/dehydratase family protein [Paenibacillus graminis]|uniref:NAD-dependent epimerase/dehydratase family protein n=1 Tax=Paenibacillus graminis TaxID=189425 RepID=UPI002DC02FBD|nr:NAD-dependent epimerase/dehydratase family protein [Paenibacillus graminis]MEC0169780.1 NAD-dependent epimerase/dehydratase family protein [Paenibacillus graminis]